MTQQGKGDTQLTHCKNVGICLSKDFFEPYVSSYNSFHLRRHHQNPVPTCVYHKLHEFSILCRPHTNHPQSLRHTGTQPRRHHASDRGLPLTAALSLSVRVISVKFATSTTGLTTRPWSLARVVYSEQALAIFSYLSFHIPWAKDFHAMILWLFAPCNARVSIFTDP